MARSWADAAEIPARTMAEPTTSALAACQRLKSSSRDLAHSPMRLRVLASVMPATAAVSVTETYFVRAERIALVSSSRTSAYDPSIVGGRRTESLTEV